MKNLSFFIKYEGLKPIENLFIQKNDVYMVYSGNVDDFYAEAVLLRDKKCYILSSNCYREYPNAKSLKDINVNFYSAVIDYKIMCKQGYNFKHFIEF